ncbi:heme peroxidase [Boletus reticuloceps]|uniref:Peroxidase n=1 Tax=Boletus reticuloceps TaxID=495285 RepID=A0A8I3AAG1_9AGAM|nr:heme peroxidase [Boletus reticuloceps]
MSVASAFRAPLRRAVGAASTRRVGAQVRVSAFRGFSTETPPPPPKQNFGLYAGLGAGAVVVGGVAYYLLNSSSDSTTATPQVTKFVPTKADYEKVYKRISDLVDEADSYDDGSFAPVLLRLAWHSSGTYSKDTNTGGSNYATMRFEPESLHSANAGLHVARNLVEKLKSEFQWISYGDLWTLAGVCAVQEMGGPKIPWKPGRIDGFAHHATPDGRLPDAAQGAPHLRDIFYRMGFNDQEIVALSGAHAVGRCHPDRSGFDGPWTFSPVTFSNEYFKLLFNETTDYVLTQDKSFKKWAKAYADDEELWFKDFSAAFSKLLELGVPLDQLQPEPWIMGNA